MPQAWPTCSTQTRIWRSSAATFRTCARLILPAGLTVATVWGEMAARAQRRGRPRPLNDSWVAACCIEGGLPLLTLNRREVMDFAERDGLVLLTA